VKALIPFIGVRSLINNTFITLMLTSPSLAPKTVRLKNIQSPGDLRHLSIPELEIIA